MEKYKFIKPEIEIVLLTDDVVLFESNHQFGPDGIFDENGDNVFDF